MTQFQRLVLLSLAMILEVVVFGSRSNSDPASELIKDLRFSAGNAVIKGQY
jgi:hypothetical protein